MNTVFKPYCVLLFVLSFPSMVLQAQVCRDVTVSLDANGYYALLEKDILHAIYQTEEHITYSPSEFTCDDIGTHEVDVLIYTSVDEYIHCTANVTVRDVTPPVAKCFSNLHVVLDGQGQHEFMPQGVNLQSTDICSKVGIRFFPSRVKCTDTSPLNVLVVARDESGNLDTCHMAVTWDPYPGPTEPIACKDSVVFKMNWSDSMHLTPEMVFQDILYGCPGDYTIDVYDGAMLRPQPFVTIADTNATITATITDMSSGDQCTASIIVLANIYCEKPMLVCDVACHSTPVGDCASGHTLQDEVEWPCDIVIPGACPFDELDPNPDNLIWFALADSSDVFPTIGFESCFFSGYYDQEMFLPTHKIIQRNWTVLNWGDQETYEYVQTIILEYDLTEICDTLPWNAPVGNCDSGHTLSDDVEWPADITINSLFAKPENLVQNAAVQSQNVRPQLISECNVAESTYNDVVTEINATTLVVDRTWVVRDVQSLQQWQYVQRITIIRDGPGVLVCVTREGGQAIPNVQLTAGTQTDVTGCHMFENPAGVIVTPVKDESLKEGVNVHDQIAIREYLLGSRTFSQYQLIAADVNQDGVVNAADIAAIDQILAGTFIPPFAHSWKFFDSITQDSFADISNSLLPHYFIGVKIGDVITADGEEIIYLSAADEVLNAGEIYEVPFYLDRDAVIRGLGMRFISPGHALEFLGVTAPQIPEFNNGNFHITTDFMSIVWIASPGNFDEGYDIEADLPFLILRFKANENTILHEAIALADYFSQEFITSVPRFVFTIKLYWDQAIVSATVDIGNGRTLACYPNPVTNEMYIHGLTDQDEGVIALCNSAGQLVLQSALQPSVDMTSLAPGMYYVAVFVDGNFSKAVPIVKIQH